MGRGSKGGSRCRQQPQTLGWKKKNNSQHSASAGLRTGKEMSLELSFSEACDSFSEG